MTNNIKQKIQLGLEKRHKSEKIFKNLGLFSIILSLSFLAILFISIINKGYSAFYNHEIQLEIDLSHENLDIEEGIEITEEIIEDISYRSVMKSAIREEFPELENRYQRNKIYKIFSKKSPLDIKLKLLNNPQLIGSKHAFWFIASSNTDMYLKGNIKESTPNDERSFKDIQISYVKKLQTEGKVKAGFNWQFFNSADSREPEIAGMAAGILGSFFTVIIFMLLAFPVGVMSAFYLEEFAPKNIITDIIEISINNLAAIPSIIFGLLGLIIYLNFLQVPRSSAIVGGLTLALLVLPIIIIATRNAIKAIPSSIKDAAVALGASEVQVMLHHTLPLALPGIMTGTILAISRAIGETAPLLMIGMVAFVADVPQKFTDPTTVMPVQIYLWSDSPELGFGERTAAAIIVLLILLVLFNSLAVFIRRKFETRW